VLLVGYPTLMAAAMQALASRGLSSLPLAPGSRILTGGGWKSFLPGVQLDQDEFRQRVAAFFRIPPEAIRDMFGLSECPAVFVQCASGAYHVPAFADARAIDPETGRRVPDGEVGLLQLTVPLTTSYPLLKILTADKAALTSGCPCGLAAPVLTPRGRTSAARFETCAMKVGAAVA
jgi:phenylacetate-coenzyme A ligase PaaK-like adenylate-forming protein